MKKTNLVLGFMLIMLLALSTNMFAQNNALDFDGSNDYVEVSADESLNMGGSSFTVEFWVKSSQNHSSEVILVEYGTWQAGTYQVASDNPNHLKVHFKGGSNVSGCVADNVNWTDGEWHHIAGVLDTASDYLYLYMDGNLIASETESSTPGSANLPLYIASRGGTTMFSEHQMDEVRIWNDARTQAEIKASMHTELSGSESGLVAYYKMNESSGTNANDETSNNNDGTLTNMDGNTDWVSAPNFDTNYALDFDGSNDYVEVSADASLNMGGSSFTVEFWVKSSQNHSSEAILVEYGTWEEGTYQVVSDNPNHLKVHFYGGTNEFGCYADNVNWTDGQWHHIAGVLDTASDYLYLYMDGSLIASETEPNTPGNATLPLYIASRGGTTMFSEHQMDEVRIWDDARTATEIQDNMNTTLTGSESNLVAYYNFNAGRGTSLMDGTTNNNMGTLTNMTSSSDWVTGYEPPYSGSGTEGDPFQISTTGDLIELSNFPGDWNKYFIQTANIAFDANEQNVDWDGDGTASWDTEDQKGFSPIGNYTTEFQGNYDGGGYTIDNLYINRSTDDIGLFGNTNSSTISNLGVTNVNITGSAFTGGLVGYNISSTVSNSYSTGSISGTGNYIGGLVGYNYSSSTVSNSYSTGSVTGLYSVGGLVGYNYSSSEVSNSYSTGSVTGSGNVGGLVGGNYNATVSNSYSTGSVTRSSGTNTKFGGFSGYNNSTIEYCYSTGSVSYTDATDPTDKGFVGENALGTYTNNFWDTETSGQPFSDGGTGKTTAEMKTESTFTDAGWDFVDIWTMDGVNNDGYSYLQWQYSETPNTAPVADDIEITTDEDVAVEITLTGSDVDGDELTFTVQTQPANGTLTGDTPNLVYTPNADWFGVDSFTYVANDGTVDSAPATVSITINASILYVSTTGSDTNDGSAENPFATIQAGLNAASEGDTVLVAAGTYNENITWPATNGIQLIGEDRETTIIDGNQSGRVIYFNSSSIDTTTLISDFTITNGLASYGGGIYCYNSSPSLVNVTITDNSAESSGGGIYCDYYSSPSLANVTISSNNSADNGGGIYCYYNSSPSLANVTISSNNSADNGGGMLCSSNSNPSLANVTISDNSAESSGGGISCSWDSSPSLADVTITSNSASYGGGGISCDYSSPSLVNCILWNDAPQEVYVSGGSVNISYSDIQGGYSGEGNIDADPRFCDVENDDYHLAENSPCVGTGENGTNMGALGVGCEAQYVVINIPADYSTIQAGLNAASEGDTVLVAAGTYTENIIWPATSGIKLIGSGEEDCIIDGNQQANVIRFTSSIIDTTTLITGFTIQNGYAQGDWPNYYGGGIFCDFSSPSLVDVTISNNSAYYGGGIYCYGSSPSLANVTITDNSASDQGGGIYCYGSSPSLANVTITGNSASYGGGIYCLFSSPSLMNVTITGNSASYDGGGIYCYGSSPNLENVTISNNSAYSSGGGIWCEESSPSLANVTISNNSASYGGGGIYCRYNSSPSLVNCILWNDAPQEVYFSEYESQNSIMIAYSDIQGGEAGIVTNYNGTVYWEDGNIDLDPLFVNAATGDYHLTENSPCIDAGNPDSQYNDPDGTRSDMGAFYYDQSGNIPDIPANVTAIVAQDSVQISWDAVSGATSYKVYSSDNPYSGFALDETGTFDGESWTAAISNTKKFFYVIAVKE